MSNIKSHTKYVKLLHINISKGLHFNDSLIRINLSKKVDFSVFIGAC